MSSPCPANASGLTIGELEQREIEEAWLGLNPLDLPVVGEDCIDEHDFRERVAIDYIDGLLSQGLSFALRGAPKDAVLFSVPSVPPAPHEGLGPPAPAPPAFLETRSVGASRGSRQDDESVDPSHDNREPQRSDLPSTCLKTPWKITQTSSQGEKSPTWHPEKSPSRDLRKSPPDRVPVPLWSVVSSGELRSRLIKQGQSEWTTSVRVNGLLILIDHIYRRLTEKKSRKLKGKGIAISGDLSRQFVSAIKRPKLPSTIQEPLALLQAIGLVEKVREAKWGGSTTCSASFSIPSPLLEAAERIEVPLSPNLVKKREEALKRKDQRLSQKHPWRRQLLQVLAIVDLAPSAFSESLSRDGEIPAARLVEIKETMAALKTAKAIADPSGTIHTNVSSCRRWLKKHLTLCGQPVTNCDISHAHWCVVARVVEDEAAKCPKPSQRQRIEAEIDDFRKLLSEDDFYQALSEEPESESARKTAKESLLKALNQSDHWARKYPAYRRFMVRFPEIAGVLRLVKSPDHKAISPALRHYTANIITAALLRCQGLGIPAIPDTDALICPEQARTTVCRFVGEELFKVTGVRCKVGGIRFTPSGDQAVHHPWPPSPARPE